MKKLAFLVLLCVIFTQSYGQERDRWSKSDTLISGTDSLYVDTLYSKYQFVVLTVRDTGSTLTDSLIVENLDMNYKVWSPIAVRNLVDFTDTEKVIAGAGNTRQYLILNPNIYIFRVRLLNTQYIANRTTYISIMAKNY